MVFYIKPTLSLDSEHALCLLEQRKGGKGRAVFLDERREEGCLQPRLWRPFVVPKIKTKRGRGWEGRREEKEDNNEVCSVTETWCHVSGVQAVGVGGSLAGWSHASVPPSPHEQLLFFSLSSSEWTLGNIMSRPRSSTSAHPSIETVRFPGHSFMPDPGWGALAESEGSLVNDRPPGTAWEPECVWEGPQVGKTQEEDGDLWMNRWKQIAHVTKVCQVEGNNFGNSGHFDRRGFCSYSKLETWASA